MGHWRTAVVVLSLVLVPLTAGAAPAGRVVIAQGVDPTTLDMMNQQEQPASNVGAQMFECADRARPDPQAGARARHRDAEAGGADHLGVQAAPGRQVPQRRGLQRGVGQVQHRAPGQPGQQAAGLLVVRADRPGGDRGSLHGADPHQEAVAGVPEPHRPAPGRDVPAQGVRGQGRGRDLAGPHRHRALQVRPLVQGRRDRDGGLPGLLGRRREDQDRRLQADPRRRGAGGRAAERRRSTWR